MSEGEGQSSGRPWDRQPKESQQAYAAFHAWLGQAQRNMAALARELGLSPSLLWRWHKRHRWAERALAFDREQARQQEAARQAAGEAGQRLRLETGTELVTIGRARIRAAVQRDPETGRARFEEQFTPHAGMRAIGMGMELLEAPEEALPPDVDDLVDLLETYCRRNSDPVLEEWIELLRRQLGRDQDEEDGDGQT